MRCRALLLLFKPRLLYDKSEIEGKGQGDIVELAKDIHRVVWLQTSFLGDIILNTAAFQFVRLHYPAVEQVLITTPLGARALAGHPALDRILLFDKRQQSLWRAAQNLRAQIRDYNSRDTVLLQAHRSFRSSLLTRLLGLPTVTYEESGLSFLARWRVPRIALLHETQRILLLLEPLGASRASWQDTIPHLPRAPESERMQDLFKWSADAPLVAIAPGSVWGTKRWPEESFKTLTRHLLASSEAKIVLLGSAAEEEAAAHVAQAAQGFETRLKNLAGQTNLDDLRALYPRLKLLISNDSSPLHYASAFQVPTLAIFGATIPALGFGPLAQGSRIAQIQLACRPCSDHGPQVCPLGHFRCMKDLSAPHVGQMALEMLHAST